MGRKSNRRCVAQVNASLIFSLLCSCSNPVEQEHILVRQLDEPSNIEIIESTDRNVLIAPILESITLQVSEKLPFDEPLTENGQEDGRLRKQWEDAYMSRKLRYTFNGDVYPVFMFTHPNVPQVCADFIVDTIDRAANTWYTERGTKPSRKVGRFDFRSEITREGLYPRRVSDLLSYFKSHPESFDVVFDGRGEKIGSRLVYEFLFKHNIELGDIVFISGKVPWDDKEEHSHSLFVTSVSKKNNEILVTGNPVFPIERHVWFEGARTPDRRVTQIVRMTNYFLQRIR